jgi:prolipoprotein diacylglyceryltransferase
MYGLLRFVITFLRDESRYFGLTTGQYLSGTMFVLGVIMLFFLWKKRHEKAS